MTLNHTVIKLKISNTTRRQSSLLISGKRTRKQQIWATSTSPADKKIMFPIEANVDELVIVLKRKQLFIVLKLEVFIKSCCMCG